VLSVVNDPAVPTSHVYVTVSDDGGDTWRRTASLRYGTYPTCTAAVDLGGGRAAAVMLRGPVWGTEDGGETWAVVGQVPDVDANHAVYTSTLGPDGRLYVGLVRQGPSPGNAWVYRTEQRVRPPVAAEPGPPPAENLSLTVQPNPARGEASVTLTLGAPAEVEAAVYDVLGRSVALLHDGPLPAGARTLAFDGAALPAGVYVVRVTARRGGTSTVVTRRLTLLSH